MKSAVIKYQVTPNNAGKSIGKLLRHEFDVSATLLKELKMNNKLYINGNACRSIDEVKVNDIVLADVSEYEVSNNIVPEKIPIDVMYEDEFILITNKHRNMSVHPSVGNYNNTLANGVIYHWNSKNETHKFHAVNRIDKDTSGICVIAKNKFTHGALCQQMQDGRFNRRYMAVVHGIPENYGVINKPIKRADGSIIKRIVSPDGKSAVTHYSVLKTNNNLSLTEVFLDTGRTHQIRVHFSYMGHPLVGDWLYGNGDNERKIAKGHLLHAYYAEFYHPANKKYMKFTLPLPIDMASLF